MPTFNPLVSILMPVYNADKYIKDAIESILNQTYRNFEFIIINEDTGEGIINLLQYYTNLDNRVKVYNQERQGLVRSLNLGINLAKGKYIARMDADDISYSTRLEKQVAYMESHPLCSVSGTHVELIDEFGIFKGYWNADIATKTPSAIKKKLLKENCLAHPTVLIRQSIIRQYLYDPEQKDSEDYDLWLRLVTEGHNICKIPEILLKYRIHSASVTSVSNKNEPLLKTIKIRAKFIKKQISASKISLFIFEVTFILIIDVLKLSFLQLHRKFFKV